MYVCICVCEYVCFVCVCMCVCMYVCIYVCVYVYTYVCIYMYRKLIHVYIYTAHNTAVSKPHSPYIYIYRNTRAPSLNGNLYISHNEMQIRAFTCSRAYIYTLMCETSHIHTHIRDCSRACICIHTRDISYTLIRDYSRACIYIHKRDLSYIHTYTRLDPAHACVYLRCA